MDFTISTLKNLLIEFKNAGYKFQTFSDFLKSPVEKVILLRHDVEARYENALQIAQIQNELGIKGTYYFRLQPKHYDLKIIEKIYKLGHETGYHYDDLSYCKGDYSLAIQRFEKNLQTLRSVVPISSACMEGAPLSKFDNRNLWTKYNRSDYQIDNEPYFDLDFKNVLYLTDTGRRWDGKMAIRDNPDFYIAKINESKNSIPELNVKTTNDIIKSIASGVLHDKIMLTVHPQRWNDQFIPWLEEFLFQNFKNQVKKYLIRKSR